MINFFIIVGCVVLISLIFLFRPFLFKRKNLTVSRGQMNKEIYVQELSKIEQEYQLGSIDLEEYSRTQSELRRRLLDDSAIVDSEVKESSPRMTVIALSCLIPILSVALYLFLGSTEDLQSADKRVSPAQKEIIQMVDGLAKKLEADPTNLKGWAMLAKSYKVMGRPLDSEKAFDRAGAYLDGDAQLLADYADIVATNAGGVFNDKAVKILDRALKADPNNLMALWLAGTAAYKNQRYSVAVLHWEKLLKLLPVDSEDSKMIRGSLNELQSTAGMPVKNYSGVGRVVSKASISGELDIDPSLRMKVKSDDVVMVFAHPSTSKMPIAIKRLKVADLPFNFVLNDSDAMSPEVKISDYQEVVLEARVSKSGQAKLESGDLISTAQTIKVGSKGVNVLINQMKP